MLSRTALKLFSFALRRCTTLKAPYTACAPPAKAPEMIGVKDQPMLRFGPVGCTSGFLCFLCATKDCDIFWRL